MRDTRTLDRAEIGPMLDRLIAGLASLRDEGRLHEPNLDGRPRDYISFDSWERPQGLGLYGLIRAWEMSSRADQLAVLEGWYAKQLANSDPGKPVIITEFGADAVACLRGGERDLFTEDCQAAVDREQLAILATAPCVRGLTPWILYDFRNERRLSAFQRGWHRKGLSTESKTTRKRAFDVLAAPYHALANAEALPAPPAPHTQEQEASSCLH